MTVTGENINSGYQCPACGMWVYGGAYHTCAWMPPQPFQPVYGSGQGWSCPHCNKAHAPWVQTCPEQRAVFVTGLSTTGSVGDDPSGGSIQQHKPDSP